MTLGKAFSDNIIASSIRRRHEKNDEEVWWQGAGRALLFASVFSLLFFALIIRLVHLTVVRGHELRILADGNRTREVIRHAPRGILFDRTGRPLVTNEKFYRFIHPCLEDPTTICTEQMSEDQKILLDKKGIPEGSFIEADYQRLYPFGKDLAHVLGYAGELTPKELEEEYYQLRQYRPGDRIGRMGAEAVFEDTLHGRNGREFIEVDAAGSMLRVLGVDPEVAGQSVTLSLDGELAKAVTEAFPKNEKGAVIVSKPSTGEILAIYSSPSFDPNQFTRGLSQQEYDALSNDVAEPLFFRAIGGVYPPGSTYKLVVALAGLEEGVINKNTIIEDNGTITIGPFSFSNWYFTQYGKTEGPITITRALQRSNDIYFYKIGEKLGVSKLADWSRKVGLGSLLGIENPGEAGGLVPDPDWKNEHFTSAEDKEARNNQWYLGDTYHLSIGQGYLLTTPLQVNSWTNVIANGGKLCKPTIKKEISDKRSASPAGGQATGNCKDLKIKKETIQLITEGMQKACEPGGTGYPLFDFKVRQGTGDRRQVTGDMEKEASPSATLTPLPSTLIPIACKTGTAEFGDPENKTHAWFTAFGPLPQSLQGDALEKASGQHILTGTPEISVTVLVEGAGEGSSVAAPVAKKILEAWFSR